MNYLPSFFYSNKQEKEPLEKNEQTKYSFIKKACRIVPLYGATLLAGYYVLGYAYAVGLMAAIDQIAIQIMCDYNMGYLAIGALMPTFQWYAAWSVRIIAACTAHFFYLLVEKVILAVYHFFNFDEKFKRSKKEKVVFA